MPVFLSHKKEDTEPTLQVANYLKQKGILCYVDAIDPELQTTDDITNKLIERIGMCTHLMAVVSRYTEKSWWVPFEIGVGTEKDRRITSCQLTTVTLPDFLRKWPVLKTPEDLDLFVQFYKKDKTVPLSESRGQAKSIFSSDQFHAKLKAHASR